MIATSLYESIGKGFATTLVVEKGGKSITVALSQPATLAELWNHYAAIGQRPIVAHLSEGTATLSL